MSALKGLAARIAGFFEDVLHDAAQPPAAVSLNDFEALVALPAGVRYDRESVEGVVTIVVRGRHLADQTATTVALVAVGRRCREAGYEVSSAGYGALRVTARAGK